MKAEGWGWRRENKVGVWQTGPVWLRPFVSATPWITLGVLLLLLRFLGGSMATAEGVMIDLPDSGLGEGEATSLVALAVPHGRETLVFFDDARYVLEDGASSAAFGEHLMERTTKAERKTLLVLADRRVECGALSKLAAVARLGGVKRVLFANKHGEGREP